MLFLLFGVEYRAIDQEHAQYLSDQKEAHEALVNGFSTLLTNQQTNLQKMLYTTQKQFATTTGQFRQTVEREKSIQNMTMLAFLASESIYSRQQALSNHQRVISTSICPLPPHLFRPNPAHRDYFEGIFSAVRA